MNKAWTDDAWKDYMYWYNQGDKATIKKINKLIKDIDRTPFEGIVVNGHAGLTVRID